MSILPCASSDGGRTGSLFRNLYLGLSVILLGLFAVQSAHAGVIYFAAHPDDIELFMGTQAWKDMSAGVPVVFVVTTAGDAGNGTGVGDNDLNYPYYRARLDAHEKAVRFWDGLNGSTPGPVAHTTQNIGGYSIETVTFDNVTMYNLLLPDGDVDGLGYSGTGFQSLPKLYNGNIATITSIDGVNTYTLGQLESTIRSIIASTMQGESTVWLNIQNEDTTQNIGDHPDHTATAEVVRDAVAPSPYNCVGLARYLDYVMTTYAINLSEPDLYIHVGTWGAVNATLSDKGNFNTWDPDLTGHNAWLGKMYASATPGGTCSF